MNTAEFLTSPLLSRNGFRHAFFTRNGGVSTGPFDSLSFSVTVGDHPDNVRENLARAARALDIDPEKLFFLSQVHGREFHRVDVHSRRDDLIRTDGDALVSGDPAVGCAVRSADCIPVLIGDRRSGGVAAVHAGWRGVVSGAVASAVTGLSGSPPDLVAAIGPHISAAAFEVSEDVAARARGLLAGPDRRGPADPAPDRTSTCAAWSAPSSWPWAWVPTESTTSEAVRCWTPPVSSHSGATAPAVAGTSRPSSPDLCTPEQ